MIFENYYFIKIKSIYLIWFYKFLFKGENYLFFLACGLFRYILKIILLLNIMTIFKRVDVKCHN